MNNHIIKNYLLFFYILFYFLIFFKNIFCLFNCFKRPNYKGIGFAEIIKTTADIEKILKGNFIPKNKEEKRILEDFSNFNNKFFRQEIIQEKTKERDSKFFQEFAIEFLIYKRMNQLFDDIINRKFLFLQLSELKIEILNQFKFKDDSSKIEFITDKLPKIPGIPLSKIQNEFYTKAKDLYKKNTITEEEFNTMINYNITSLQIQHFSLFWLNNMKFITPKICDHFYYPFIKKEIIQNKDVFILGTIVWSSHLKDYYLPSLNEYNDADEMNFKYKITN